MNSNKQSLTGKILRSQEGRIGYLVAWLLGVPSSVLLIIFLLRGH